MVSFLSNIFKMTTGTMIAQIVGILLSPIVTRIYSPEFYGIFLLFFTISSILVFPSCLSYQFAIMLPKEDEDSANIVALCLILVCATSVVSGGVFILLSEWVGEVLNTPEISQYLLFLPVVVFLNGLIVVINYWLSRRVRFGALATAQVVNSVSSKAAQIGVGIGSASPLGLILGLIVGCGAALLVMLKGIQEDFSLFRKAVNLGRIKRLAKRYRRFPLFTSWSTMANSVSLQIAPLMLTTFFSPAVVGFYGMAHMVVSMPMSLICSATGQVFFQKASEERNQTGSVKTVVHEVHQRLVSIGIFPILILMIIGEELFTLILGAQWATAGVYARILAPWLLLDFIADPLSTILVVFEKQTVALAFHLTLLFSRIAALYVGGIYGNPVITIVLLSLTGVVFWGWMDLYILKVSGIAYRTGLEDFLRFLLVALAVATPLIVVEYLSLPLYILLIVAGIVTCIYYAVVISGDPILKKEFTGVLQGMGVLREVRP